MGPTLIAHTSCFPRKICPPFIFPGPSPATAGPFFQAMRPSGRLGQSGSGGASTMKLKFQKIQAPSDFFLLHRRTKLPQNSVWRRILKFQTPRKTKSQNLHVSKVDATCPRGSMPSERNFDMMKWEASGRRGRESEGGRGKERGKERESAVSPQSARCQNCSPF